MYVTTGKDEKQKKDRHKDRNYRRKRGADGWIGAGQNVGGRQDLSGN